MREGRSSCRRQWGQTEPPPSMGEPRSVDLVLDTFGAVAVQPDEQIVLVSMARTGSIMLTVLGLILLAGSFALAFAPVRRRDDAQPSPTVLT